MKETQLQFSFYVTLINVLITTEIIHLIMTDVKRTTQKPQTPLRQSDKFRFQYSSKFFSVVPHYSDYFIMSPPTQCLNQQFFRESSPLL